MKKLFLIMMVPAFLSVFINYSYSQTGDDSTKADVNVQVPPAHDLCPVSGMAVEPGTGAEFTYLGTKYKFCCYNCLTKFKSEPMNYIKAEVKCPVSGESASKEHYAVVDDVKYYFCCSHCKGAFEKEPQKYLNKEQK